MHSYISFMSIKCKLIVLCCGVRLQLLINFRNGFINGVVSTMPTLFLYFIFHYTSSLWNHFYTQRDCVIVVTLLSSHHSTKLISILFIKGMFSTLINYFSVWVYVSRLVLNNLRTFLERFIHAWWLLAAVVDSRWCNYRSWCMHGKQLLHIKL